MGMKAVSRTESTTVWFLVQLQGSIIINYLLDTEMSMRHNKALTRTIFVFHVSEYQQLIVAALEILKVLNKLP